MKTKDLTGLVMKDYGVPNSRLTVLKKDPTSVDGDERWICQCECGNIISVKRANLIRKDTKGTRSCGCMKKEISQKFTQIHYNDLTNKRFGMLVCLQPIGKAKHGYTLWRCICDCGNECNISSRDLLDGSTKSCGCLKSYGETVIQQWLTENNFIFEREYSFQDLTWKRPLRFDFKIILQHKFILIEYQGPQHYDTSSNWYSEEGVMRDALKKEYCKSNKIELYEIFSLKKEEIIQELKNILGRSDDLSD